MLRKFFSFSQKKTKNGKTHTRKLITLNYFFERFQTLKSSTKQSIWIQVVRNSFFYRNFGRFVVVDNLKKPVYTGITTTNTTIENHISGG